MKTDRALPIRALLYVSVSLLFWSIYWISVMWMDVAANTALGRGEVQGDLAGHHVFELIFVAAHGGIRWFGGVAVLAGIWFVWRRVRSTRREPAYMAGD